MFLFFYLFVIFFFFFFCFFSREMRDPLTLLLYVFMSPQVISTPHSDFLLLEAAQTCLIKHESLPSEWKAPAIAFLRSIKPTLGLKVKDTERSTGAVVTGAYKRIFFVLFSVFFSKIKAFALYL